MESQKDKIIKRLREHAEEKYRVKYHLSYDTIDCNKHFKNDYNLARKYMLCVLGNTLFRNIESYNNSTFILEYDKREIDLLFKYLEKYLKPYFYYSISMIAKETASMRYIIDHNPNMQLNANLQAEMAGFPFDECPKIDPFK